MSEKHSTFAALFTGDQQPSGRRTTGGRGRKEKRPLSKTDGRARRGLGRDRQFNVQVTQDWVDAVEDACERFDLTKNEFAERAGRFYIAALEAGETE